MDLKNKNIHIIGMGDKGSGQETAKAMIKLGYNISISDIKTTDELKTPIQELSTLGNITFHCGNNAYTDIEKTDIIIVSPGVPSHIEPLKNARKNGIPVISEIELAYSLIKAPVIAITGTKGKTTTTTLAGLIAKKSHLHEVYVGGNIGKPLISIAEFATEKDIVIAEVSSFQLENIINFHPKVAVFTNLYEDHLDRYNNSMDEYFATKLRVFENQTENDFAVLNIDLSISEKIIKKTKAKIIPISLKDKLKNGIYIEDEFIISTLNGTKEIITDTKNIRLRGTHNLANILASIAAITAFGLNIKSSVEEILSTFKGVENRLEEVDTINGISFYNDSQGTTPMAVQMALNSFPERSVILIAGGRAKVNDFSELGKIIAERAKAAVLIGEAKETIAEAIRKYSPNFKITFQDNLPDAVVFAFQNYAESGDNIIMSPACASFDMFRNMEHRGKIFKETVAKICQNMV